MNDTDSQHKPMIHGKHTCILASIYCFYHFFLTILFYMKKLGTVYGGWALPEIINFDQGSIIYSAGVGEDISFDLILSDMYNCCIILIDPTERAKIHFEEVKNFYKTGAWQFSGDIQDDYHSHIKGLSPDFSRFRYVSEALWYQKENLRFYKQENAKYVSQSLIPEMFGPEYNIVPATTIKTLMSQYNHNKIDLLKLDIEGAEIEVLNNIIDDAIFPKYLCVEFDLFLKGKDSQDFSLKTTQRLERVGYRVLANYNYNITFIRDI